jgi:transcriptional regulator with XRE-family HTH domain
MNMSGLYQAVGLIIRRRRRALELTQAQLAYRLGISRGALANIETGRQNMLVHQLYRFAAALEMSVHDLLPIPTDMSIHDLLPLAKGEADLDQATNLPMPKGLTPEQRVQVTRVFSPAGARRSSAPEVE